MLYFASIIFCILIGSIIGFILGRYVENKSWLKKLQEDENQRRKEVQREAEWFIYNYQAQAAAGDANCPMSRKKIINSLAGLG